MEEGGEAALGVVEEEIDGDVDAGVEEGEKAQGAAGGDEGVPAGEGAEGVTARVRRRKMTESRPVVRRGR